MTSLNLRAAGFTDEGSIGAPDGLILGEYQSRKITVKSGAGVLVRGTVLGVVTADGKYLKSLSAAVDGSQAPDVILAEDVDATSADKSAIAYFWAEAVDQDKLVIGTGHTIASVDAVFRKQGIFLVKPMG
jgi:hypothetical protein